MFVVIRVGLNKKVRIDIKKSECVSLYTAQCHLNPQLCMVGWKNGTTFKLKPTDKLPISTLLAYLDCVTYLTQNSGCQHILSIPDVANKRNNVIFSFTNFSDVVL